MRLAVIGSRNLMVDDLEPYLPAGVTEIVSGGAKGIDACAKRYALQKGLKLTEFLPQYHKYGKAAPLLRNLEIIQYADQVVVFWDGRSRGTKYVIDHCAKFRKQLQVFIDPSPSQRGSDLGYPRSTERRPQPESPK